MYNRLYLPNMWLKFLINQIKIDGSRALRRGPEKWREKWCEKWRENWCEVLARKIFPPTATENKIDTNGDHQGT